MKLFMRSGARLLLALGVVVPSGLMVVGEAGAVSAKPLMICTIVQGVQECGTLQYFEAHTTVTNSKGNTETATNTVSYIENGGKIAVTGCVVAIITTGLQTTISDGTTLIFDGALAAYSTSCVYGAVVGFLSWLG